MLFRICKLLLTVLKRSMLSPYDHLDRRREWSFPICPVHAVEAKLPSGLGKFILSAFYLISTERGTRQFVSFATTTTRQRNRGSGTRQKSKNVTGSVSKWSSFNVMQLPNNFVASKHCHIVAAVLSRAQLYYLLPFCKSVPYIY